MKSYYIYEAMTLTMTLNAISIYDFSQYETVFVLIINLVGKRIPHFKYGVENKNYSICFTCYIYWVFEMLIKYQHAGYIILNWQIVSQVTQIYHYCLLS